MLPSRQGMTRDVEDLSWKHPSSHSLPVARITAGGSQHNLKGLDFQHDDIPSASGLSPPHSSFPKLCSGEHHLHELHGADPSWEFAVFHHYQICENAVSGAFTLIPRKEQFPFLNL